MCRSLGTQGNATEGNPNGTRPPANLRGDRYALFYQSVDTPFSSIQSMSSVPQQTPLNVMHNAVAQTRISLISNFGKTVMMRGMRLLSIIVTISLFIACWQTFYPRIPCNLFGANGHMMILVLYAILVCFLSHTYNAFEVGMYRLSELVYSQNLADLISTGIIFVMVSICWSNIPNPIPLIGLIFIQALWNKVWSYLTNKLYFHMNPPEKTAIIYRNESDLHKLEQIKYFSNKFCVHKYIKDPSDIHHLIREVEGCAVIFVAGVNATLRNGIAKYCVESGVQGYIAPHVGDVIMAGAKHMHMFSAPIMRVCRASLSLGDLFIKRAFDIVGSLIGIIIASPFMLGIALAIKLNDGGPVLYKQVRLTRDHKEFNIWKFRSMHIDAEKDGVARLAAEDDDRITSVGKVIRAIRFDELPQLFNILGGSMAIVGPRPERPEIAALYEKTIPAFSLRLQVKAGLTGYAQIYGRYNTEPYDKLQMDLMYINNISLAEDLRLILATVKILFMKESTAGIEGGQETAINESDAASNESA